MEVQPGISVPAIRRLPRYLNYLRQLQEKGQRAVSATSMAMALDIQHTLVRKDLAFTGVEGQPKVGHQVIELIQAIEKFLNWNNTSEAFLVGVGHMGTALLNYTGFKNHGIRIVAGFDADPIKVGRQIGGCQILPITKLANLIGRMHVRVGIIAVPPSSAQSIADLMIQHGIRAIWNFAPVTLRVPAGIIVEDVDIYASLAVLSKRLNDSAPQVQASTQAKTK